MELFVQGVEMMYRKVGSVSGPLMWNYGGYDKNYAEKGIDN